MRVPVELRRAYKLVNHGPTTLISATHGGRANAMAAAWVMALDFDPPKLAAVLASDTYTRELVDLSGECVVSLPTRAMAELTYALGTVTGRGIDKLAAHGVRTAPASKVGAPLIEGCVGWLECRVVPEPHIAKAYDLYVLEVVAAWADDAAFAGGEWRFTDDAQRTLHHMAGGTFFLTGDRLSVKPSS